MGKLIHLPRATQGWRTYCQDCDPACERPLDVPARRHPFTGDFLTPCPACDRYALAEVPRARSRRSGRC